MESREAILLNSNWEARMDGVEEWSNVCIPHNFDNYHGYHKVSHGNLHGTGWYRRTLTIPGKEEGRHCFLFFEGVGSYADIYLNERHLGRHEGGRTCFSLEATDALLPGRDNLLSVRAEHPAGIKDLPWVCGGCFGTPNTEGSQPFGIFRPVSMYFTGAVRLVPFGVWITTQGIKEGAPRVHISTELQNLEDSPKKVTLESTVKDPYGKTTEILYWEGVLAPGEMRMVEQVSEVVEQPALWFVEDPNLYRVISLVTDEQGQLSDQAENTFGMRYIQWENFAGTATKSVDSIKLQEEPEEKNQYFNRYTKSGAHAKVGIVPGGVRVYLPDYTSEHTVIRVESTLVNRDSVPHRVSVDAFLQTYNATKHIANLVTEVTLDPGESKLVVQETERLQYLDEWSEKNPVLHGGYISVRDAVDCLKEYNQMYVSFAVTGKPGLANKGDAFVDVAEEGEDINHRFLLNGKHVFLNGTCEYENLLGNDHAFEEEQIKARMTQIQAAGFSALREAHCPHNLRYQEACDQMGILYWAQMGAHLYFDNPEFHDNFIRLTTEWVRERRNSPSVILWGIQNECLLPTTFADEVRGLIRSLDHTATKERLITTCNGGSGSDWNVPQNWCGTYGGSCLDYGEGVKKQLLVGEYGQYRVLGKHQEGSMEEWQNAGGNVSEELFCYCLEHKIRQAEELREKIYGHFQWIFNTHANPGREEIFCLDGEGVDGIGVVNSKGLLTAWGEPTDGYYMYCSHYADAKKVPMVYLVSHTWPDRFISGQAADIVVYSNCEEVELFEGLTEEGQGRYSLGRQSKGEKGTHLVFRDCLPKYNVLTAVGYADGRAVTMDRILLRGLKEDSGFHSLLAQQENITLSGQGEHLYRINCGGKAFVDCNGQAWAADARYDGTWGWSSWAESYPEVDPCLGSVRTNSDFVKGSRDQELFRSYRYGREKLRYDFAVPKGEYLVELYFMEPWYSAAEHIDCTGWRLFDVAINDKVVLEDLDLWKKNGFKGAWKESAVVSAENSISITFPHVASYQAVICGIAIIPSGRA